MKSSGAAECQKLGITSADEALERVAERLAEKRHFSHVLVVRTVQYVDDPRMVAYESFGITRIAKLDSCASRTDATLAVVDSPGVVVI